MPAPTITREWEIDYGSTLVIGGASGEYMLLKQGFGIFESYRQARVTCLVLVNGAGSTSTFLTNATTFQTQMRIPRQRLQIKTPSGLLDLNPTAGASTNTGFDAEPEFEKSEQFPKFNTGTSRVYRASWTVSLPADLSGQSGRQDAGVATEYEPNRRRTIEVSGRYTALAAADATAQYENVGPTYATSVLPSGSWQFISETRKRNDTDKVLDFTRKFRLITVNQDNAGADNASVVDNTIIVSIEYRGLDADYIPGEGQPLTTGFIVYACQYRAVIDITVTAESAMRALWDNTLRARAVTLAKDRIGGDINVSAIDSERLELDLDNNVIIASFNLRGFDVGLVISYSGSRRIEMDEGLALTPVSTGRKHEYAIDQGPPKDTIVFRVEELRRTGSFTDPKIPQGFVKLRTVIDEAERVTGYQPTNVLKLKKRTLEIICQRATPYVGGGASGTPGDFSSGGGFLTGQDRLGSLGSATNTQQNQPLVNKP